MLVTGLIIDKHYKYIEEIDWTLLKSSHILIL